MMVKKLKILIFKSNKLIITKISYVLVNFRAFFSNICRSSLDFRDIESAYLVLISEIMMVKKNY